MARRRRSAGLLSAALLICAAVPALAHDGQDPRPGAARVDLEVLLTPALNGETSPGGQDGSVAVDRFGNVFASALKENVTRVVTADGRATTKTRLSSWRWSSGDDGESFQNVGRSPAQFDTYEPGGTSSAVASDDAGNSFYLEGYAGLVTIQSVTATEKDAIASTSVTQVAGGVSNIRVRADAVGNATTTGRLYYLAGGLTVPGRTPAVHSGPTSGLTGTTTDLPGATNCTLAADHRRGSKFVYAACQSDLGTADLWTSKDAGATFVRRQLNGGVPVDAPSVSVAPDGSPWVLVSTGGQLMAHHLTTHGDVMKDLASEKGTWRGGVLDVSKKGRLGLAAYHLAPGAKAWHVRLSVVSPGATPLWVDFASHDPVSAPTEGPPDSAPAVAFGPDSLLHVVWGSTKVTVPGSTSALLRNIWSVRTISS
jgi:hypothetical protein